MLKVQQRQRVESAQSIMLGEEAGSDKINLFYQNMCQELHKQQRRAESSMRHRSAQDTGKKSATEQMKLALRREQTDFILPARPMSRNPLLQQPPLNIQKKKKAPNYSSKERQILNWAFKKFEEERRFVKKEPKNRFKHEFWFEKDDDVLQGAECNKHINLADYDDEQADADFFRKHRSNAVTGKTDIARNRYSSHLDRCLIDLSRKRFKILAMKEFQKKSFVQNQLRKSDSMPGLRSERLMLEDLSYKPKRTYKTPNEELVESYLTSAREELENEHKLAQILAENTQALMEVAESEESEVIPEPVERPKSILKEKPVPNLNLGLLRSKTDLGPVNKGPMASTPRKDLTSESATELTTIVEVPENKATSIVKPRTKAPKPVVSETEPIMISRERSIVLDKGPSRLEARRRSSVIQPPRRHQQAHKDMIKKAQVNFDLPVIENPIMDSRISTLLTLMDKAYITPVERNVDQIVGSIDALKANNDDEAVKTAALLKKERERCITSAVARKVKKALYSREYSFSWE